MKKKQFITAMLAACLGMAAMGQPAMPDPILALAEGERSDRNFNLVVAQAVSRHPALGEAVASQREAKAARVEARSALFPTVDLTAQSYRVIARNFNPQDLSVLYENSRAQPRTDVLASVSQTVFDFGATSNRISAATARLKAATAGIDDSADKVALAMIAAWYDVFTYRALAGLADRRIANQRLLRTDVGELAAIATQARAAGYRRQLANAEARFRELSGEDAPADLARVPAAGPALASADMARAAADTISSVQAAVSQADAARQDARASRADRWPQVSAGIQAGRYGILENKPDYDVRAQVMLRQRFSGAVYARANQTDARALEAQARADRIRQEAERDAAIAWSDVQALDAQVAALEGSYVAGRDARINLAERFRVARGTLFDVLQADDEAFANAANFIEAMSERDAARYVLLSRTGRLLSTLSIDTGLVRQGLSAKRFEP